MSLPGQFSASTLEEALGMAGLGCWVWTDGESAPRISANFGELLGQSADNLPDTVEGWLQLAHHDDRASLNELFAAIRGRTPLPERSSTIRFRHGSGAWSSFDFKARHLDDSPPSSIVTFKDITREQQTEAALRDSQLRYRALYSTAPLAFILWNKQGHITEWNRRAEAMFGWQSEAVIGKPVHHLLLPSDQHEEFNQAIRALIHHTGDGLFTGPAIHKSGYLLECTWYSVPLRNPQGALTGVLSLVLDVTEEKVAAQRLQKSEKTYRTLVETSPDAILLLTLDGRITTANQQAQTLFGLDVLAEENSHHVRQILPPRDIDPEGGALLDSAEDYTGFIVSRDLALRRVDGSGFDASIAFTTVMDSAGHPSGIVLFVRDVTEKLRADRELEDHRKNLERLVQDRTQELEGARDSLSQIIDGSPVPTFVLDANHVITHWNKACESVIGVPAAQMLGTRNQWRAFYNAPRPVMADLVMTGDMDEVELLYHPKYRRSALVPDGFEAEDYFESFRRWLFFTAAPLRNAEGEIIGAIETLQDVSERKQAEIALMDAKSIAETAAKAKADFLANMSHEIRTPMNAVIGIAHLLLKTELSRKQQDYVSRIQGAGQILLGLINDVLDFSKIEAGRMQLEATEFSLDKVLTDVATVVVTRAQEKGLELQYVVDPDLPPRFIGDPLRLTQILVNLIGNAIKFTAKGSVTAFFRQAVHADGSPMLEVDVQDTGIGMTLEQQASLFQAFTQADTSITRNYGGTGLGLTISKRLVELMEGRIWVTSHAGVGSTFSFNARLGWQGTGEEGEPGTAHVLRALVVDDNPLARTVLRRLLEKYGCATDEAASAEEALALLAEPDRHFDYVTIDLYMPGMDGLELAAAIRRQMREVPRLVLVTAADITPMDDAGQLRNFHFALNKPITAAQIRELLTGTPARNAIDQASQTQALAGLRILLAEDVPTNQLIATEMLSSFGAKIETADNGQLVLEAFAARSHEFDLILMDVQMPEMDGLQATREIRRLSQGKDVPIIAMTAHALDEEKARCLAAGMNDFITKPIDPAILVGSLLRWKPKTTPKPEEKAMTAPENNAPAGMPDLPGIDTAAGLRRMMNKISLYERVLKDFHKRFAGEAALIRAALAANDRPTAERHAHSTKGLSGSIGATALQAASLALEEALRAGEEYPAAALDNYEAELNTVLNGIAGHYPV